MLVLTALVAAGPPEVVLTRDGQARATVVLAQTPTRAAQLAAFELQHHVKLITGAELPIVKEGAPVAGVGVCLGDTAAARAAGLPQDGFAEQEFAVRFADERILLVGRDAASVEPVTYDAEALKYAGLPGFWEAQGTLHAAYDFLEKLCGVRWLNPTDLGTIVPRRPTLTVPATSFRRRPGFSYRDAIGATGDNPARYDAYTQLWAAGSPEFKAWSEAAYADLRQRLPEAGAREAARVNLARLYLLRRRNGGDPQRCNHSLYGYYDRFWRRPETRNAAMFAHGYVGEPPQMCYSSKALIEQLAQDARDYYDGRKTGADLGIFWRPQLPNRFPIEPMDNRAYCKCVACQAKLTEDRTGHYSTGVHSDYFFGFADAVVKELKKTHPDRTVMVLAYSSHAAPPVKVTLDPSVAVQFCFTSDRAAGGPDGKEVELLRAWAAEAKQSGRPLYLWLYDTFPLETARNGNYHCFPGFFAHQVGRNLRLFGELGYRGMFHCGFGQEVEAYVTFKLMDEPGLDVDRLLDDYFTGLYGAAAGPMKRMYLEMERAWLDPAVRTAEAASKLELYWSRIGSPARMTRWAAMLEEARALATAERDRRAVALFEASTWSYMLEGQEQLRQIRSAPIPSVKVARVAAAGGDPAKVDWSKAAALSGPWYRNHSHQPAVHKLSGRVAHDGAWLYLELTDACETAKLTNSAMVFPLDDWEVFVAAQRGQPYRQYAWNPAGLKVALSHGEVNFRRNVPLDPPFTVVSDATAPDRWVSRLAVPLAEVVSGGAKPGGRLYLNVIRVWALPGQTPDHSGIDAWGPFTKVHDLSRAPELRLE